MSKTETTPEGVANANHQSGLCPVCGKPHRLSLGMHLRVECEEVLGS